MALKSMDGKELLFRMALFVVCALIFLVIAYPLYFIVIASFSDSTLVATSKVLLFPKGLSLFGYKEIFQDSRIWTGYRNTVFYTLFGTLVNMVFTMLSRLRLVAEGIQGKAGDHVFVRRDDVF